MATLIPLVSPALLLIVITRQIDAAAPHGLLVNGKRHPALGISGTDVSFGWVVPHINHSVCGNDQHQESFQLQLKNIDTKLADAVSDTAILASSMSLSVGLRGDLLRSHMPNLEPSSRYAWRVRVWTVDSEGQSCEIPSGWSTWSHFITAPFTVDALVAQPIWFSRPGARYTLHRLVQPPPESPIVSAIASVTAVQSNQMEKLLGAYRLIVNGVSVGIGPGRGLGSTALASASKRTGYDSIDLTSALNKNVNASNAFGLQCYHKDGGAGAGVLLQINFVHEDGTKSLIATGESDWVSFDATAAYNPVSQEGAYQAPMENIDAALMPSPEIWPTTSFVEDPSLWQKSAIQKNCSLAATQPYPKTTLPLNISAGRSPDRIVKVSTNTWFFDFGTEIMGGIRLEVPAGALPNRTVIQVTLSEELVGNYKTSTSLLYPMRTGNTYRSLWTTNSGAKSVFEHHEYMEFRYVEVAVKSQMPNEIAFKSSELTLVTDSLSSITAWAVAYPFFENDSYFSSSDATLNAVWLLCENSLRVTSLDTATDSNTRERLPYEADGYITGLSRLALQREFAWIQHSWRHNIENPTWPTEWRQTAALFAEAYWKATGELGLVDDFGLAMEAQTQSTCMNDHLGLVDFGPRANKSMCPRQTGGMGSGTENNLKDIVDWPNSMRDGFVFRNISTVINSYAFGGLRALSTLGQVGGGASSGLPSRAHALGAKAEKIAEAMNKLLTVEAPANFGKILLYADGYDTDSDSPVQHPSWHAQVFPAAFGLLPESRWQGTLDFLRKKGGMIGSVYAAFWALRASYKMDSDHGALALKLMTSCAENSWCHMINVGATAVMEAWTRKEKPNLSWSHPWASAPASAVVWGLFGIEATTPAFKSFVVKPQPGNLTTASIKVPTMSGAIKASFNQPLDGSRFDLYVSPPAGTSASVCLPKLGMSGTNLWVDGKEVEGSQVRDYICVYNIGSASKPRQVSRK